MVNEASKAFGAQMSGSIDALTDRQRTCLLRVAEGRTSKEIAREFAISPSTVDNHVNAALKLVGCASRLEAARLVLEHSAGVCIAPAEQPQAELAKAELPQVELVPPSSPTASDPGESRLDDGPQSRARFFDIPPLGGSPNWFSASRRLLMIVQILVLGLMVGVGAIVSILGVVRLLAP